MKEMKVAVSPEKPAQHPDELNELHIVKKYGKFHGHMVMAGGGEHKFAPKESMGEMHAEMGKHMESQAEPGNDMQNASESAAPDEESYNA